MQKQFHLLWLLVSCFSCIQTADGAERPDTQESQKSYSIAELQALGELKHQSCADRLIVSDTEKLRLFDGIKEIMEACDYPIKKLNCRGPSRIDSFPDIPTFACMTYLCLEKAQIKCIPSSITYLANLKRLELPYNQVSEIPSVFKGLEKLHTLYLSHNQIKTIPHRIVGLDALAELDLANNQIECVPDGIMQLHSLVFLFLSDNNIKKFPSVGIASLQQIVLCRNYIESLPENASNYDSLGQLNLNDNNVKKLPPKDSFKKKFSKTYQFSILCKPM